MRRISFLTLVIVSLLTSMTAWGQDSQDDLAHALSNMFRKIQEREPVNNISDDILAEQPEQALDLLSPYEQHPSSRVRSTAYAHLWKIGRSSSNPRVRREVVSRLVEGCNDPELVWQHCAKWLLSFEEADFTFASKAVLHDLLMQDPPRGQIVLVVGVAGMREELPRLKSLLIDESVYMSRPNSGIRYGTLSWRARLARARMGVQEDVQRAIELVELEENAGTRVRGLLRSLGYTRQPAAFEAIRAYLESEESLPAQEPCAPAAKYATYALDVLTEHVPNFPVKAKYPGAYSAAEIKQAREWMRKWSRERKH